MQYKHKLPTLEELRTKRKPVRHVRRDTHISFTPLENVAIKITHGVGSIGFFFILAFWTLAWLLWNLYAPLELRFDPGPAFVIWLIASNIIQLVLLPLIMVGQNLEGKFDEQRSQEDFDVNIKAEREIEVIIAHLENQEQILKGITDKLANK